MGTVPEACGEGRAFSLGYERRCQRNSTGRKRTGKLGQKMLGGCPGNLIPIEKVKEMKKAALVTGGSRGIGLGIAKSLAQAGFDLAINGVRNEEDALEALEELRQLGAEVLYCQGDVGDEKARKTIIDKIKDHFGRLNLLVNNAGVAPKERKDILEATQE